ncbi:MAG TPA: putative sporulation protein YtxC [Bacillota bacterium]|nr:putative sporulation protein YtxC [Bacillota bacterium]
MATILIGTRQPLPILRQEIELEYFQKGLDGTALMFEERQTGRHGFLEMTLIPSAADKEPGEYQGTICEIVCQSLMGMVAKDFLEHIARVEYPFATRDELLSVVKTSRHILEESDEGSQRELIRERIREFLNEHHYINLEGFLRFRLKEYFSRLREVVEQALESFLAEKEYREFIRLLRYFVENQEPRVVEVHVVIYTQDLFRLLDDEGKPLEPEYLQGILGDLAESDLNYEDLLLSALITLSPKRLIIHQPGQMEIAKTIEDVFRERVVFCRDCDLCRESFPGAVPSLPR